MLPPGGDRHMEAYIRSLTLLAMSLAAALGSQPVVVMPKSTGPLSQRHQWFTIADNCGPSRKLRNLAGGVAVNSGFWRRTLLQGRGPGPLMPKTRVPTLQAPKVERT